MREFWPNKAFMKNEKRMVDQLPSGCRPPAYPFAPQDILTKLRRALQSQRGSSMIFRKIAQMTGQKTNSAHYWWHQSSYPHILAFISLIEQLSPASRQELVGGFCRVLPTLEHPRLSNNLQTLAVLLDVLRRPSGMTILSGGSDSERSLVTGVLGHALLLAGLYR